MHNGQVVYAKIKHQGKMHQNKKNGAKTYTRHIDVQAEIPDHLDHVVFSTLLVNMADPDQDVLIRIAEQMTLGLAPTLHKQGEPCYASCLFWTDCTDLTGPDIIDDISLQLPTVWFPFGRLDANSLARRLTQQFRNADGPVWFSSMIVKNPSAFGPGHVWAGTKTEAGLTPPAVYEVIWKVTRL